MHMADALVSPAVAGTMYVCSAAAMGYAIRKVKLEDDEKRIPVMGVMGAFVFATQMVNFSIPGTGSSGHLCGGMLLSAILGPYAGFLTMIGVLLIQCLLFADGGILALGCNIWNMAFYGCFVGVLVVWRLIMKNGFSKRRILIASLIGCVLTLQLGAFSVVLQTLASGITELPFGVFIAAMQPIHLAIGFVEGLITSAVLCFIYEARPELLWGYQKQTENSVGRRGKLSYGNTVMILAATALVIGGLVSLAASADPDGLEWSIKQVTGTTEVASSGAVYDTVKQVQDTTALLPDYAFKGSDTILGTSFSGVIGGLIVVALLMLCAYIPKIRQRKRKDE